MNMEFAHGYDPYGQPTDEELAYIRALAQEAYPGRDPSTLTDDEITNLYRAYSSERSQGRDLHAQGVEMMQGAGREVGPYDVFISNPYESLAGGLMAGVGMGMQRSADRGEAAGRQTSADLLTRSDAIAREDATRAERERRAWLERILGWSNR